MNQSFVLFAMIALAGAGAMQAQLKQNHPELCGATQFAGPLPAGLTAKPGSTESQYDTTLTVERNGIERTATLDLEPQQLEQICMLPGDQLITFGESRDGNFHIDRINATTLEEIDFISGRSPVISPDAHWLIMLPFHHAHADFLNSEEYMLYDLTKDAKANRMPGATDGTLLKGVPVYPIPHDGLPFVNEDLPPELTHEFRSESFYWSSDSKAVIFADSVNGHQAVVLVSVDSERPVTLIHPIDANDACKSGDVDPNYPLAMEGLEFGPQEGSDRVITVHWSTPYHFNDGRCTPQDQTLHTADFVPPTPEVHQPVKPAPLKPEGAPQ